MNLGTVFISELVGTAMLILLGAGVVANVLLRKSKGYDGGWLLINIGWGLAVFAGVYVAYRSGGHINPAVTLGILASGEAEYAPGVAITFGSTLVYIAAQFIGAFIGACLAWAAYKPHFDNEPDESKKLGVFSTGPEIRNYGWNFTTEVIATFVLVFVILSFGKTPTGLGPLAAALLVVAIGASLGGPTGYAINPARDLGPRVAHAVLPLHYKGSRAAARVAAGAGGELPEDPGPGSDAPGKKGSSDWGYSWVPVFGPIVGGVLAGLLSQALL
ncbi:MAG: MIP/aquaporin family protein [Thermocrispum agreste]|uniref:Aquaporin family protein n=1 Tax=Thermocrispum agreste TaxID=37925 RepID=A0A2W4K4L0_9PSEU|nr:MAG: aquaporin family protein [Thermocrispum agreste]